MRRQRWLHRNQAVSVVNAYAEAMNAGKNKASGKQATKITGDAMFGMLRGKGNLGN